MKDFKKLGCGRIPEAKDRYLSGLPLSLDEQIVLTLARHVFQSFSHPGSMGWLNAMAEAEARFGYVDGPQIAARVVAVLQAVRRARSSVFMFNSPSCPGCAAIATEHERRLIMALHAIRSQDMSTARLEVMMLCEGNRIEIVLNALSALATVLNGDALPRKRPAHQCEDLT